MTTARFIALFLAACCCANARAGLYNPAEQLNSQLPGLDKVSMQGFKGNYGQLRDLVLQPLRNIGMPKVQLDTPVRVRYRMMTENADAFAARSRTEQQQLSLSEYLIRRNEELLHLQAARLLENLTGENRSFLAFANLGTEYLITGNAAKAADAMKQTLAGWPESWDALKPAMQTQLREMRWTEIDFDWFRKVETYQHKLADLRSREKWKPNDPDENVDAIFGDAFAFTGNDYAAGKLTAGKTIPNDALQIVQQLLVWMPNDRRLQWLLGEVYNAKGDVESAQTVMKELTASFSVSPYRPRLLTQHLQVLKDYVPPPPPPPPPTASPFDLRSFLIGGVAGAVLAFIAYWQFREIARRRSGR